MRLYSTNNKNISVSLREAVTKGLAPDGGLFMPEEIKPLPSGFFSEWSTLPNQEIATRITQHLIGDDVPLEVIKKIVADTVSFKVPLVQLEENVSCLELFHGPTLAFKDFGARFMAALLGYFAEEEGSQFTILVATSGDTGSAVAHGFHNVKGIKVIVLYPSGKVSDLQEKQFTTLGDNITAIEVEGTFDDCQRLVKSAFKDDVLREKLNLTSANSINIARLIPQSFYYFFACARQSNNLPMVFSVPSGNFGNLTGGVFAQKMGLPVRQFVAATNANDVVPQYLKSDLFLPRPSVPTISNAMDVGDPSNFARLLELFNNDYALFSRSVTGYAFSDDETRQALKDVFESTKYVLDPHGTVGYLGLKKYLTANEKVNGIFLKTAHPGKFREMVEPVLGEKVNLPERLTSLMNKQKRSVKMSKQFSDFREYLIA